MEELQVVSACELMEQHPVDSQQVDLVVGDFINTSVALMWCLNAIQNLCRGILRIVERLASSRRWLGACVLRLHKLTRLQPYYTFFCGLPDAAASAAEQLQWNTSVRAAETMLNNSSAKKCTLAIVCRASEMASVASSHLDLSGQRRTTARSAKTEVSTGVRLRLAVTAQPPIQPATHHRGSLGASLKSS